MNTRTYGPSALQRSLRLRGDLTFQNKILIEKAPREASRKFYQIIILLSFVRKHSAYFPKFHTFSVPNSDLVLTLQHYTPPPPPLLLFLYKQIHQNLDPSSSLPFSSHSKHILSKFSYFFFQIPEISTFFKCVIIIQII